MHSPITTPSFVGAGKNLDPVCFSVVTAEYTLSLQAKSLQERNLWIRALCKVAPNIYRYEL